MRVNASARGNCRKTLQQTIWVILNFQGCKLNQKVRKQEDSTQGQVKKNKQTKKWQDGLLIATSLLINTQVNDNMKIPEESTIYPNEQN